MAALQSYDEFRPLIDHTVHVDAAAQFLHNLFYDVRPDAAAGDFGGRAAFFPENKNTIARNADILRGEMVEVYPQLKDAKVEYVWGSMLDFAFDMMTHVGETDGIYYSLGYAGHGVAMATYLGKTVAEAMMNGNIQEHPVAQVDFPGAPLRLYNGRPWFLPIAGAWHKILDWIE